MWNTLEPVLLNFFYHHDHHQNGKNNTKHYLMSWKKTGNKKKFRKIQLKYYKNKIETKRIKSSL